MCVGSMFCEQMYEQKPMSERREHSFDLETLLKQNKTTTNPFPLKQNKTTHNLLCLWIWSAVSRNDVFSQHTALENSPHNTVCLIAATPQLLVYTHRHIHREKYWKARAFHSAIMQSLMDCKVTPTVTAKDIFKTGVTSLR